MVIFEQEKEKDIVHVLWRFMKAHKTFFLEIVRKWPLLHVGSAVSVVEIQPSSFPLFLTFKTKAHKRRERNTKGKGGGGVVGKGKVDKNS